MANNKPDLKDIENTLTDLMYKLKIFEKVDLNHTKDTPHRIAKMLVEEVFSSLYNEPPKITTFKNDNGNEQIVIIKDLEVRSMCAHHWMPFYGFANIAYIPGEYIAGLSKFGRIVDYFSRKPQVQEKLAKEIIEYLNHVLKPKAIGIYISCTHMCMRHRGLESDHSVTDNFYIIANDKKYEDKIYNALNNLLK